MSILLYFTIALFILLCLLLTVVVLIQESKSMGFGASFGGDSGDSLFGVSTPQILKVFTGWLAVIFMSACVILSYWTTSQVRNHSTEFIQTDVEES